MPYAPEVRKEKAASWYQKNKESVKKRSRKRHQTHREEILAKQAVYRAENAEVLKEKARKNYEENRKEIIARTKSYAEARPEWRKAVARKAGLKAVGWTPERYDKVFAEQSGVCAICKQPVDGVLDADHKHVTPPEPRGLLCHLCNMGIGAFKDDPARLKEAIKYLRKYDSDAEKKNHGRKRETNLP